MISNTREAIKWYLFLFINLILFSDEDTQKVLNTNSDIDIDMVPEVGREKVSKVIAEVAKKSAKAKITIKQRNDWMAFLRANSLDMLNRNCPSYKTV